MDSPTNRSAYAFEIADLEGEDAIARVRQCLRWTFPEQPAENIERALARRPVRFAARTTPENAERLRRQIGLAGARVRVSVLPPPAAEGAAAPGARQAVPGTPAAAPAGSALAAAASSAAELRAKLAQDRRAAAPGEYPEARPPAAEGEIEGEVTGPPRFFWSAWKEALFSPVSFFAGLRAPGGTVQALLFAATLGLLAMILSFPASMLARLDSGTVDSRSFGELYLTGLFTQPLATVVATCLMAWLFHFGLRMVAGPRPFEVTLKVVAYTTAATVFAAIPKAGPPVAAFLALLLTLVGLSSAQRVTPIRAFGAVVLPLFVMGLLLIITIGSVALGGYLVLEALWS